MEILRTDDDRFSNLPGYSFKPNYVEIEGLRMHFLDEGGHQEEVVLMIHGEPSWSYLYRKMIPVVVEAGYRVVVPDLIGFGRSDKPTDPSWYTYKNHLSLVNQLVEKLNLNNITLVCQDWGGLLGLRSAVAMPERFKRVVAANTMLPTGEGKPSDAFLQWKEFSQTVPEFPVAKIIAKATVNQLSDEVLAAYDAPFPDEAFKVGARVFPKLVPLDPNEPEAIENRKAWQVLKAWKKPFLTAFSDGDPIMKGLDRYFQDLIPGAKNQKHCIIKDGGHFLQEDKGEELAQIVVQFIKDNP